MCLALISEARVTDVLEFPWENVSKKDLQLSHSKGLEVCRVIKDV